MDKWNLKTMQIGPPLYHYRGGWNYTEGMLEKKILWDAVIENMNRLGFLKEMHM